MGTSGAPADRIPTIVEESPAVGHSMNYGRGQTNDLPIAQPQAEPVRNPPA